MTQATIGYLSQFWLEDPSDSTVKELGEVRRIQMPNDGNFEHIEVTHLKSPGRRRQFIRGFRADQEFEVELNYVVESVTETIIRACSATDATYDARIVEYDGTALVATHNFTVRNVAFTLSDLEPEGPKMLTMRYRLASDVTTTYP